MRAPLCPLRVAAFLLVAICGGVSADEICVSTGEELAQALALTSTNGFDNSIHVVAGSIVLPSTAYGYAQTGNHDLDIEGGWTPGCTAQSHDAALTVLDGAAAGDARMSLFTYAAGNVTVRYLTFAHYSSPSGVLLLEAANNGNGDLRIENCLFTSNAASASGNIVAALNDTGGSGAVYFLDNAIIDNVASGQRSVVLLQGGSGGSTCSLCVNNNTVSGNALGESSPGAVQISYPNSAKTYLANNVLWGNGGTDLNVYGNSNIHPTLFNNDIGTENGTTPASASAGNISSDPQFVSAAHGDYRLQFDSPVRDAGTNSPPGTIRSFDVLGTARIDGVAVDMGAYEYHENIFADGFQ